MYDLNVAQNKCELGLLSVGVISVHLYQRKVGDTLHIDNISFINLFYSYCKLKLREFILRSCSMKRIKTQTMRNYHPPY